MRLFLVGMCDIFLILYLTTLGQVDRSRVSDLTVADYLALQEMERETSEKLRLHEEEARRLEEDMAGRASELLAAQKRLQQLKNELKERKDALDTLKNSQAKSDEELARLRSSRAELLKERATAKENIVALTRSYQKAAAETERLSLSLEKTANEKSELEELVSGLKESAEAADRQAEQARQEARAAKAAAEEANAQAARAEAEMRVARASEQAAKARASKASKAALDARIVALKAEEQASRAKTSEKKVRSELKSVVQPTSKAYQSTVQNQIRTITIETEYETLLLGTRERKNTLKLIPVHYGSQQVVLLPVAQAGFEEKSDSSSFTSLRILDGKRPVRRVLVKPGRPGLIAVVLPGTPVKALQVGRSGELTDYTPTLFAVRNGSRMYFGDRIRDLAEDYFVFKRDRLSKATGDIFSYAADGIRGTRDYGERIIVGDQVVDLRGRLFGIGISPNRVLAIGSLKGWVPLDLNRTADAARFLRTMWMIIDTEEGGEAPVSASEE